jgi:large subunit ribosomal protein L6
MNNLTVKGPKGQLVRDFHPQMTIKHEDNLITIERPSDETRHRALHGLTRSLISNMVTGVTKGFERILQIQGVGYKADAQGDTLTLSLGFSHPINYKVPKGVSASVEKQTTIKLEGIDNELLGQVAADVRSFRPPEPYKGKGIRYMDEFVLRKEGKKTK